MEAFSKALITLYDTAALGSPDQFSEEVVHIAGRFVAFDGAVLGSGIADPAIPGNFQVGWAHVHDRDSALLQEYETVSAQDPVTKSFMEGLAEPVSIAPQDYYRRHRVPALRELVRRHEIGTMLLYGRAPAPAHNGRWLALFRKRDQAFSKADSLLVEALWPHVGRAIDINLRATLEAREVEHSQCGSAFINSRGFSEFAEPAFVQLVQLEWPGYCRAVLPVVAISALAAERVYRGRHINLFAVCHANYMICTARRLEHVVALGPLEKRVAFYFAGGMTNKEIASRMGTSPHTVRMQLKIVYRKLDVHSKVGLARAIS